MAHENAYLICENKCLVPGYSREQTDAEIQKHIGGANLISLAEGKLLNVKSAAHSGAAVTVYGVTYPTGLPSPDAPKYFHGVGEGGTVTVRRTGKNLLIYPYAQTSYTGNGLTFKANGDGSVTVNGTATSATSLNLATNQSAMGALREAMLDAGTLTLSGCPQGGSDGTYCLEVRGINDSATIVSDTGDGATFEFTNSSDDFRITVSIRSGFTANNLVFLAAVRSRQHGDRLRALFCVRNVLSCHCAIIWRGYNRPVWSADETI